METSTPSRDVWGNFNSQMKNAFLVNLSELSSKETKGCEDQFKALITDSAMTINEKGVAQYTITSHHKFITTTNNDNPTKIKDGERRHVTIRSSDELIGNKVYFNWFHKTIEDVNVIRTVYDYFKDYDLSNYNYSKIPKTEHQTALLNLSVSQEEQWLESMVFSNQRVDTVSFSSAEIYSQFIEWCKINKPKYETSERSLVTKLAFLKLEGINKDRSSTSRNTVFDIQKLMDYFTKKGN